MVRAGESLTSSVLALNARPNTAMRLSATDPLVQANAECELLYIGADPFAQAAQLIDERDLGCQETIGSIFDQLGGLDGCGDHQRSALPRQRAIKLFQHFAGTLALAPRNDSIRVHEIVNCTPFPEKLRIGGDRELILRQ